MDKLARDIATKRAPASNGCIVFTGCRDANGYGILGVGKKYFKAHRVAWQLTNGQIPEKLFVCHTCDNPPCINPEHLFVGTALDNNRDKSQKGRAISGNYGKKYCVHGHKFTEENTIRYKKRRYCKECHKKHQKNWRLKNSGKPA